MIDDSAVLYISIRPSSVRGVSPVGCGFHSVLRRALQLRVIVAGGHTHTHTHSSRLSQPLQTAAHWLARRQTKSALLVAFLGG